jgi:hypothetical protein
VIEKAFMSTIRYFRRAAEKDQHIKLFSVMQFIISLLDTQPGERSPWHERIAITICQEILQQSGLIFHFYLLLHLVDLILYGGNFRFSRRKVVQGSQVVETHKANSTESHQIVAIFDELADERSAGESLKESD